MSEETEFEQDNTADFVKINYRQYKAVERWSYFNSIICGFTIGLILGKVVGALVGSLIGFVVNYGVGKSAIIAFNVTKTGLKEGAKIAKQGIKYVEKKSNEAGKK